MSDNSTLTSLSPPPDLPPSARPVSKVRWGIHLALMAALPIVAAFGGAATHDERTGPHAYRPWIARMSALSRCFFFAIPFGLAWLASRASCDDLLLRWRPGYWVLPLGALYSVRSIRLGGKHRHGDRPWDLYGRASPLPPRSAKIWSWRIARKSRSSWTSMRSRTIPFTSGSPLCCVDPGDRRAAGGIVGRCFVSGRPPRALAAHFRIDRRGPRPALQSPRSFGRGPYSAGHHWPAGLITVVGFLLGVIMTVHRSVWPSVVAHGLFDATSIAPLLPWAMEHLPEWQRVTGQGG